MKCKKCEKENLENSSFCSNCGTNLKEESKNDNSNIYLAIFAVSVVCSLFCKIPGSLLIAIITIVTGKIKCPNNLAIKILFWITIIFLILYIILIIWIMIACGNMMNSCS